MTAEQADLLIEAVRAIGIVLCCHLIVVAICLTPRAKKVPRD